jgi:hypothetical protein
MAALNIQPVFIPAGGPVRLGINRSTFIACAVQPLIVLGARGHNNRRISTAEH